MVEKTYRYRTAKNYRNELDCFSRWLGDRVFDQVTFKEYRDHELERIKVSSVQFKMAVLKAFVGWLYREEYIDRNFAHRVQKPTLRILNSQERKAELKKTPYLIPNTIHEVIIKGTTGGVNHTSKVHQKALAEARNALLFLWKFPLRQCELFGLLGEDLYPDSYVPEFIVVRKGGKAFRMGLPYDLLDMASELRKRGKDRAFLTSNDALRRYLKIGCKKVGIDTFTPHFFRNLAGTWMVDSGAMKEEAAHVMGHSVKTFEKIYQIHSPMISSRAVNTFNPAIDKTKAPIDYMLRKLESDLEPLKRDKRINIVRNDDGSIGQVTISWKKSDLKFAV